MKTQRDDQTARRIAPIGNTASKNLKKINMKSWMGIGIIIVAPTLLFAIVARFLGF